MDAAEIQRRKETIEKIIEELKTSDEPFSDLLKRYGINTPSTYYAWYNRYYLGKPPRTKSRTKVFHRAPSPTLIHIPIAEEQSGEQQSDEVAKRGNNITLCFVKGDSGSINEIFNRLSDLL